jgi:hypothetical protein
MKKRRKRRKEEEKISVFFLFPICPKTKEFG